MDNIKKKVEKCLERVAIKNANSTSSLCFYEPNIPIQLKDVVQEKYGKKNAERESH